MGFRRWFVGPRRGAATFLAVTLVPALAFAWLGWRLLDMDRVMETQRVRDRLDGAAALVAAALDRRVAGIEEQLPSLTNAPAADLSDDAVIVRFGPNRVEAWPKRRLLYYPVASPADESGADSFEKAGALEFSSARQRSGGGRL